MCAQGVPLSISATVCRQTMSKIYFFLLYRQTLAKARSSKIEQITDQLAHPRTAINNISGHFINRSSIDRLCDLKKLG